jgi:chitodextrinase
VVFPALLALVGACSGDNLVLPRRSEVPSASAISVVEGDGQTGQVGEMLEFPLEVVVTDTDDEPVPGATVVFELTSAGEGAEISPSSTTTDAAGRAEAQMVLGDKVGIQTGAVHVVFQSSTGPSAPFSALARPAKPEPPENPENHSPDADYNWHCEGRSCQFTDASSDHDGTVVQWRWSFGDGATSEQAEPLHVYPAPGEYEVTLMVTDNDGATDESTAHVDVDWD